ARFLDVALFPRVVEVARHLVLHDLGDMVGLDRSRGVRERVRTERMVYGSLGTLVCSAHHQRADDEIPHTTSLRPRTNHSMSPSSPWPDAASLSLTTKRDEAASVERVG